MLQPNPSWQQNDRNYGIDLLRIVSMLMVVLLHCLLRGGILGNTEFLSLNYEAAWLLEILSYCAVNCYALISGFVGYGKKVKYSNLIYLMIQVTFYTTLITALFAFFMPSVIGLRTVLYALFPIVYDVYWYVTAYFCMYFFLPFLNQLVEKSTKSTMQKLLLTMFFVFCVLPTFYQVDIPDISWGYTPVWLVFLYLFGAYIKKYGFLRQLSTRSLIGGYFLFGIGTWAFRFFTEFVTTRFFSTPKLEDYLIRYNSPTIFMCGVFLLLSFSKLRLNRKAVKIVSVLAPTAFGVYIIHNEPLIWQYVLDGILLPFVDQPCVIMLLAILTATLCIFLICSIIDRLRLILFNALHIKQFCVWIEQKIRQLLGYILRRYINIAN